MSACHVCGAEAVHPFLSFGELPLGNAFLVPGREDGEEKFPLELGFCENCSLVQQVSPPPVGSLRRDYTNYRYVPTGSTLAKYYYELGGILVEDLHITPESFVLDIGSNDGQLLSSVRGHSYTAGHGTAKVLGIEPAVEISKRARRNGVDTITDFFTTESAEKVWVNHGPADVVTMTQTLQHIPDARGAVKNVYRLLKPGGVFVVEGRYFGDTVRLTSFDTVYHEMLYFFTLEPLARLLVDAGLVPFRAERVDIYGGSLRVYAKKPGGSDGVGESVTRLLDEEREAGLDRLPAYLDFAERVRARARELRRLVAEIKKSGRSIAGYGAPSTGTTLLNFCEIDRSQVDYIVDDSPLKQGLLQPGTHIPIVDSSRLASDPPDYLLIIAWRLKNEILGKVKPLASLEDKGTKVVVPLPVVEII